MAIAQGYWQPQRGSTALKVSWPMPHSGLKLQKWKWPLTEDNLWQKMTFDGRRPLMEDDIWRKTTFDGRQPWSEDDIWQRRPSTEEDLQCKTTFDRVYSLLPKINVYDSSSWQLQHNRLQSGNPISCQNQKKNLTWWKKCIRHHACWKDEIPMQIWVSIHHVLCIVHHASCIMHEDDLKKKRLAHCWKAHSAGHIPLCGIFLM